MNVVNRGATRKYTCKTTSDKATKTASKTTSKIYEGNGSKPVYKRIPTKSLSRATTVNF